MQSSRRPTLPMTLALLATLALPACAAGPTTLTIPVALDCAGRIPPQLRADVTGAPLPADNSIGEWVAFGDAQTGRLESANDRKATMLWIVEACEAEEAKAAAKLDGRPWWKRLTSGPPKPG